ncbi:MAG TPA: MSMEG_0567/Sll0786 family nitrogen starvation N-acetyltransferase [Polyangiaceae bacterium]|nr:MSMEG_0567/Sll0786 family nitrogen starvation N-acetyltransferase [Polyangiaceae bacterium]
MLDRIHPWGRPLRPGLGTEVVAEVATERWQIESYWALRRSIFVAEQRLFETCDRDARDPDALPIVAMSQIAGMPDRVIGVVRIYNSDGATWYGGRLGVAAEFRRFGAVGTALIQVAVSTAHALGCGEFLATVQLANVRYFERHHFSVRGSIDVAGQPHRLMEASLDHYPPRAIGSRFCQTRAA